VVERDLQDASINELSADRRFATAYNAALQLTMILMHFHGYRAGSLGHHKTAFEFLALAEKKRFERLARYFDLCRKKRNITDYDRAAVVSTREVEELIEEVKSFRDAVNNLVYH